MSDYMDIKILDTAEFIRKVKAKEVKTPTLFIQDSPHPEGLLSQEIFGQTPNEKRALYGYIKLNKKYIHPLVYRRFFKRSMRNVDKLINGTKNFIIEKGKLVEDDDKGITGISFLYKNFDKIKKSINDSIIDEIDMDEREAKVLTDAVKKSFMKLTKEEIFTDVIMVVPLIHRDINVRDAKSSSIDELNGMYQTLIRLNTMIDDSTNILLNKEKIDLQIQNHICVIYDYFKNRTFGKNGLQRRKVMGRSIDYTARNVMSAPFFKGNFGSSPIDLDRAGIPLSTVVDIFNLHMIHGVKVKLTNYFDNGLFEGASRDEFDAEYNNQKIKEMLDRYVNSWGERSERIKIPDSDAYVKIILREEEHEITLTELLYMVAYEIIEKQNKVVSLSRYPIQDEDNDIISYIHILSTINTIEVEIDGIHYPYYPDIEMLAHGVENVTYKHDLTAIYHETIKPSNTLLPGWDGDFDGDKLSVIPVLSEESIKECQTKMNDVSNIISYSGGLKKFIGDEIIQALYSLSIQKPAVKTVSNGDVQLILGRDKDGFNPDIIFSESHIGLGRRRTPSDKVILQKGDYKGLKEKTITTLGRLLINKIVLSHADCPYYNVEFDKKNTYDIFNNITKRFLKDEITIDQLKKTVKVYEDFGFRMSSYINPSLDPKIYISTKKLKEKKEELFKKYAKELENNNIDIASKIEDELIALSTDEYKDNSTAEWYNSKASGKLGFGAENKMSQLMIGAIPKNDGTFYVSTSNYIDGYKKEELPYFANQLIQAAAARALETADGGYMAKQASSTLQTVVIDKKGSDCGTDKYIVVNTSDENYLLYRYTSNGVLITYNNVQKYLNKDIKLRSPFVCESKKICSKCAGEFFYKLKGDKEINIGLSLTKPFTELVQASLQKTHVMGANVKKVDINNYIE